MNEKETRRMYLQPAALIRGEKPKKTDGEVLMDDAGHVAMRKASGKKKVCFGSGAPPKPTSCGTMGWTWGGRSWRRFLVMRRHLSPFGAVVQGLEREISEPAEDTGKQAAAFFFACLISMRRGAFLP